MTQIIYCPIIDPVKINRAYAGKPGKCMCGCSGKYYEADSPIVKRIAGYVSACENVEMQKSRNGEEFIYTAIIGGRQYTIYVSI